MTQVERKALLEYFDEEYYLKEHPEVKGMDPLEHYNTIGYKKGYEPAPNFHGKWYLAKDYELYRRKLNPLVHWVVYGKKEKRKSPIFDTSNLEPFPTLHAKYDILLIVHEFTLTGAPRIAYYLALISVLF